MSNKMLDAVWDRSKSRGGARLVLLAMADEANDEGYLTAYKRSQSHLGRKAALGETATRDAIKKLVELGEVQIIAKGTGRDQTDYRLTIPPDRGPRNPTPSIPNPTPSESEPLPPADRGPAPRNPHTPSSPSNPGLSPSSPSAPAAPAPDAGTTLFGSPSAKPPRSPESIAAVKVTRAIYEARDPRPTTAFVGVVGIVKRKLAVGWSEAELVAAGTAAMALTDASLEVALQTARRPARRPGASSTSDGQAYDERVRSFVNGTPSPAPGPRPFDVREATP
jgi:hypothetical protein